MKKIISFILSFIIAVCALGCSSQTADKEVKSDTTKETENIGTKIKINGDIKNLVAYNIKDNNYFKLRDIANVLKGTEAEFDVIWNEEKQAIEILSHTPYSTDEELTSEIIKNPIATSSYVPIYMDGSAVLLGAYNIAENNYFKLRDIASVINFGVDWNESEEIIEINTEKNYKNPENSVFGLNTQYLSYIGKTKAEIDNILGFSTYSMEWGMSTYNGNIMIGWNSLGEEPSDSSNAVSMYIPLDKLFFNCPASVTKNQVTSLFNSYKEEFDEMGGENVLIVNYCGKALVFYPDSSDLSRSSSAFINVSTDYVNPSVESVQIINSSENVNTNANKTSLYYDYAKKHDSEFWSINKNWRDDKEYYYLVDVDHDSQKEMVVKIGCGIGIYKIINGKVEEVFYDILPDSAGSVQYWVAKYDGREYIIYTSASSSQYRVLYTLNNGNLNGVMTSLIIDTNYTINDKIVTEIEYNGYVNSIDYLSGMSLDGLK